MVEIDKTISSKLSNLGFVCTLLVVFIHCTTVGSDKLFIFLRTYVPGAFLAMAVPTFFAISGFLLAGSCGKINWYKNALAKRVRSLLLPYVILNCLWFPVYWGIHAIAVSRFGADDSAAVMTLSWQTPFMVLGFPFFGGPSIGPLWYIATLMYFVLFSPVVYLAVGKSRSHACLSVLLTVLIFLFARLLGSLYGVPVKLSSFLYYGFSLWGLIFFTLGMAARLWLKNLPMGLGSKIGGIGGAIVALVLARYGRCDDNVLYVLPTIFCIVGVMAIIPSKPWPRPLIENSFALYALHVPFLYLLDAGLKALHLYHFTSAGWGLISEWLICIVVIISLMNVARKVFPNAVRVCLGGR